MRPFFLLAATAAAAFAQNSDIGLLVGVSPNYAIQLRDDSAGGRLYLEFPLIISGSSTGTVTTGIGPGLNNTVQVAIGTNRTIFFFTPGVRWKFNPTPRVSLYLAGGAGMVAVGRSQGVASNGSVSGSDSVGITGAFGLGGGLDLRLTRLVSLRADAREALSVGTIEGAHHHEFFMIGAALHF